MARDSSGKEKALGLVLFVAMVWGITAMLSGPPSPEMAGPPKPLTPEEAKLELISGAKGMCQAGIMKGLNDPDSAEFTSAAEWPAKLIDAETVHVEPMLRAKNGFGAMMLGSYICEIRKKGDGWEFIKLDQVID